MNMRRILTATAASGAILLAGVGLAACGSSSEPAATTAPVETTTTAAAGMVQLTGDDTYLVLDAGTAKVLADNKVTVAPVAPAEAAQAGIAFPVIGEQVDAATLKSGTITHTGGLTFSAGDTKVTVKDFSVDLSTGILTAMLPEGASLPLLKLDLSAAEVSDTDNGKDVKGVVGVLTADAATALNNAFGVEFFAEDLPIGTLDLDLVAGDSAADEDMSDDMGSDTPDDSMDDDMGTTPDAPVTTPVN